MIPEPPPTRDRVFISYSHKDSKWLARLQVHFAPFERRGKLLRWDDTMIAAGARWQEEISRALAGAKVAVLLVSAEFLASNFITNEELPTLLSAAENDGVIIIPVILSPCAFDAIDEISQFQSINPPSQPLTALNKNKREQVWVRLAKTVTDALAAHPETRVPAAALSGRLCNVPARNPLFVDREELLCLIGERLTNGRRIALSGLAGIGKTEAAIEYAYRHRLEYTVIFWIRSDSRQQLHASFIDAARFLDLPEWTGANQNDTLAAVSKWLAANTGWLIIFDDADDLGLATELFPNTENGHIVITTRAQATIAIAASIEVEPLNQDEAIVFLLRRAKLYTAGENISNVAASDYSTAQQIAIEMGGLPLALDQAGGYIEETSCGVEGYLDLWTSHRAELLAQRPSVSLRNSESVAGTWLLSCNELAKSQPQCVELLRHLAFLHPDAIPIDALSKGSDLFGQDLGALISDPWRLNNVIKEAIKFSLLRRDPKSKALRMHRLMQTVLRDGIAPADQAIYAERAVRVIEHSFPEAKFANWELCERLSAHAQVCAASIDAWKLAAPFSARLLHDLGYYLYQRGRYLEAASFVAQAVAVRRQIYGNHSIDYALSLDVEGQILRARGEIQAAEQKIGEALEVLDAAAGANHRDLASVMNHLATLKLDQHQLTDAKELFLRALGIAQLRLGTEDPEVAQIMNNLAAVYFTQGEYSKAREMLEYTLNVREKILPKNHPSIAQAYNNLAAVCSRQKHYADAERFYKKALSLREDSLGPTHPYVAETLYNLALAYIRQGRSHQADGILTRARAIREESLGLNHPRTADVLTRLAEVRLLQKKVDEAQELYARSLSIREAALGKEHPDVGYSLMGLADVEEFCGRKNSAETLLRQAYEILKNGLGSGHPDVVDCSSKLNKLCLADGTGNEAESL